MSALLRRRFEADLEQIDEVLGFVERTVAGPLGGGERMTDLLVAVEEAFTNVAKHAYDHGGVVEVAMEVGPGSVTVTFIDEGRPFDPLSVPPPDLEAAPEDRIIGSLGIHLMKSLVDRIDYRREGGRNVLTMTMGARADRNNSEQES